LPELLCWPLESSGGKKRRIRLAKPKVVMKRTLPELRSAQAGGTSVKVYHGTNERTARRTLKHGIRPRGESRKRGNWAHTVQSNPDMVYLTNSYASYFAISATTSGRPAVIEIELDNLDKERLFPDEDFIEQALRAKKLGTSSDPHARTKYVIEHIDNYQANWKLSLEKLGNVCYRGTIPASAITKIVAFDVKQNPHIALDMMNPTITLANYQYCGEKYRQLTQWLVNGHEMDASLATFSVDVGSAVDQLPWATEIIEDTRKQFENRSGIETIFEAAKGRRAMRAKSAYC
jgi:hypothetical protein